MESIPVSSTLSPTHPLTHTLSPSALHYPSQCTQCYGAAADKCTACSINATSEEIFFKADGLDTCLADCGPGRFGDFFSRTCRACLPNCLTCTSASSCELCAPGSYLNRDGTCSTLTACTLGESYETLAPTNTSDRTCTAVTACAPNLEYISVEPTLISDQTCAACTKCDTSFQERKPNTCRGTLDAECVVIDRCIDEPCKNGGNCTNEGGRTFTCACAIGFCDDTCETAFVNGACPVEADAASSAASSTAAIGAGVGFAILLIVVLALAVVFVRRAHARSAPGEVSPMTLARFRKRRANAEEDEWELDRELLTFTERELGKGHFGRVVFAVLQNPSKGFTGREVAVKEAFGATEGTHQEREFVREMNLMKALAGKKEAGKDAPEPYPFVTGLVGVCTLNEPLLLVVEFADEGDLASYLRRRRPQRGGAASISQEQLVTFAAQCACGMDYLESHRVRLEREKGERGRCCKE